MMVPAAHCPAEPSLKASFQQFVNVSLKVLGTLDILYGADMTWADMTGAGMSGADMTGAVMTGAVMTGADMTGLFCRGHFDQGRFVGAVLSGPNCRGRFVGADLSWTVLTGHAEHLWR